MEQVLQAVKEQEILEYRFEYGPSKISPGTDIKRHNSVTRYLWAILKKYEYKFFGTLRDWTAVFQYENMHIALHHFVNSTNDDIAAIDHVLAMIESGEIQAAEH